MIILLQSVTIQSRSLLWHISYYKVRQNNFITKCDRLLLQSVSGIVKCDRLYLQSASGIIRCVSYYKVRRNIVAQNKLVQSLFLNKVAGLRTEFCKIFKKSFLQNISGQLLLMTFPGVIYSESFFNNLWIKDFSFTLFKLQMKTYMTLCMVLLCFFKITCFLIPIEFAIYERKISVEYLFHRKLE